jgi:cytochrome c oxidase assembly protein subunit 15
MVPEMTGGVFWEHLHRLVAGGLLLFFSGAIYLTWKDHPSNPWLLKGAWVGLGLLLVQAVLGGVTVLMGLPDAVSTSHLGLAFLFLALATALTVTSAPSFEGAPAAPVESLTTLRTGAMLAAVLAFGQSIVGAAVRHTDAGMACPDVPLCLGRLIPPFSHGLVVLHFAHRALGVALFGVVLWVGHVAFRKGTRRDVRALGLAAALVAGTQVLLGFLTVYFRLAVVPVSLHTLLAALLLTCLVALSTLAWTPAGGLEPKGGAS